MATTDPPRWAPGLLVERGSWLLGRVAPTALASALSIVLWTAPASADEEPKTQAPADAKPADAKPADAKPGDAKAADAKAADAKAADAKPADTKPGDAKPADTKPADAKAGDAKPTDAKPADAKAGDAKPADAKPADTSASGGKSEPVASADAPPKNEDEPPSDEPEWERQEAVRRSGLTVGLMTSVSLGKASGYPLDLRKIGRASYYTETSIGVSGTGLFWVGAALTDWLTFGAGVSGNILAAGDRSALAAGALLRVETFPLWSRAGIWRDAGVILDGGLSLAVVEPTGDDDTLLIDGGAASYVGGGVFYEGFRFGHISAGPFAYASYIWSDTIRYGTVSLGARMSLYTGPSREAPKPSSPSKSARTFPPTAKR